MENAINQKLWTISDRETGVMIDQFSTEIEAKNALIKYENEDRHNGDYSPDFYEITTN